MRSFRALPLVIAILVGACSGQQMAPTVPSNAIGSHTPKHRTTYRAATASPDPNNVWVHYDYMVFEHGLDFANFEPFCASGFDRCVYPPGFTTAPDPQQIAQVVAAFRNRGLTLHIDPQHTVIPGVYAVLDDFFGTSSYDGSTACVGPSSAFFSDLKAKYFHPRSNHPWHYAVFGFTLDSLEGDGNCGAISGVAELPGFDFVIAPGPRYIDRESFAPIWWGGTFMHELGHNLGLRHGGDEDLNYKPNYLSIMNYRFQSGIPQAAALGSTEPAGFRVDYSPAVLNTLDERHLDENAGIGAGTRDISYYFDFFGSQDCINLYPTMVALPVAASGPVDWNCDGVLEPDVADDLMSTTNLILPLISLHGFNDWAAVKTILTVSPSKIRAKRHVDRDISTL